MLHLGLAAASLAQPHAGETLDDAFWQKPVGKKVSASMEKVIEGIKLYQLHPFQRPLSRHSVVWSSGQTRLVWHAAKGRAPKARILIVPSLINGAEIVDMLPYRSLLRWLAGQGFDVYLLEWGDPRRDPEMENVDKIFRYKIKPMLAMLQQESDLPLHGVGYCMGGLLLTAMDRLHPKAFSKLCFIATPWNFKAGSKKTFAEAVQKWAKDGLARVRHYDYMPADWLQMIFAGVDAGLIARKFSSFAEMKQSSREAELFVAVEDWVNGGADLPAGFVQQCVGDWYLENKPYKKEWRVAGKPVIAKDIDKPCLVIVPGRDKIVPPNSARALARQLPHATLLEPDCGHISMMIGKTAEKDVWKPLAKWLTAKAATQQK